MYKINIKVSSDRRVDMSSYSGGVTGEKNTASLVFDIPGEYSSYNKYLDIFKESGEKLQTVVSVKDEREFSYILPGELCDNLNVYMQLVMKKGDAVFKSYRFVIAFEEGINVTSYLEDNFRDSIQELFEIKADKDEVSELSKALLDKVATQVFYNEKQILENKISEKADADDVVKRLNLKADKAEVYEKLSLKADKSEMLGSLELKADKTDVEAELMLKADKEEVETELSKKLDITDAESYLSLKVDKEEGKVLSSNNFTDEEKEKLSGIADGAEVNVQADWNELNDAKDSYIKNKPDLSLKEDAENKVSYIDSSSTSKQYPTVNAVKSYVKNYTGVKDIGDNPDFDSYTSSGIYTYCIYDSYRDGKFYDYSGYTGLLLVSYHDISGMILGAETCYYQVRLENGSDGLKMFYRMYNGDIYGDNIQEWSEWEDVTPISKSEAENIYATKEELSVAIGEALEGDY